MRSRILPTGASVLACALYVAIGALTIGCGSKSPAGPSSLTAPKIDAISPSNPIAAEAAQPVTFTGNDFRTGLVLEMTAPGDATQAFGADAIQNRQDSSFSVMLTLSQPGIYQFVVKNLDNQPSDPFSVNVQTLAGAPQLTGISPAAPARNSQPQTLVVSGLQFVTGLTVTLTSPSGAVTTFVGADISGLTPTSFVISATLSSAGVYGLMVTTPTGESSNLLSFTVTPS